MNRDNDNRRPQPHGFTLVELMVVIAIMGILAGTVTVKVLKNRDKAKIARAQADIKNLELAAKQYDLNNSKPISSLQDLVANNDIEEVPKDPWGGDYTVEQRGDDVKIRCANLDSRISTGGGKIGAGNQ